MISSAPPAVEHVHTLFHVCFLLHEITCQGVSSRVHDRVVEVGAEVVSEGGIAESLLFTVIAGVDVLQLTRRKRQVKLLHSLSEQLLVHLAGLFLQKRSNTVQTK